MIYNEKIDILVNEINNLNSILNQNQNDFFIELDSLKELQNNINTLSIYLKNSKFIENEIEKLVNSIINYSVLDNIPVININEDNSNNIVNIINSVENTTFFPNKNLSMTDDFTLRFENKNINYRIPLYLLKNNFSNYYKMNNMIIFVYGFSNEQINIIESNANIISEYPYITENLDIKNLVNLFINNTKRYKMLILNGKHSNLLGHNRKPNLTLLGNNPFDLSLNTNFIEPGYDAQDYKGIDISVNIYNNINNNLIGNYDILYVATDNSGNQNIKNRKVNVV